MKTQLLPILAAAFMLGGFCSCEAPHHHHPGHPGPAADRIENHYDRREDIRDRREDRWDRTHYTGPGDRREDVRDRREDYWDRREDRWDRRH